MLIGQAAAGVGTATTIDLTYMPQVLYWANATTPQALRVIVEGDGTILDLDTAGLNALKCVSQPGRAANGFYISLANGFVPSKNTQIIFTNGVAAAIDLYGYSLMKPATKYVQSVQQNVLANSGIVVSNFMVLALPNAVTATDIINVEYVNGHVQRYDAVDLAAMNAVYQNDLTNAILVNNLRQNVRRVDFTPALAQNVYKVQAKLIGNISGLANY